MTYTSWLLRDNRPPPPRFGSRGGLFRNKPRRRRGLSWRSLLMNWSPTCFTPNQWRLLCVQLCDWVLVGHNGFGCDSIQMKYCSIPPSKILCAVICTIQMYVRIKFFKMELAWFGRCSVRVQSATRTPTVTLAKCRNSIQHFCIVYVIYVKLQWNDTLSFLLCYIKRRPNDVTMSVTLLWCTYKSKTDDNASNRQLQCIVVVIHSLFL